MMRGPEYLTGAILQEPDVYDPNGPHHEFKDGGHGYKVDMEQIPPGSELFCDLVDTSVDRIHQQVGVPALIISIANGGKPWADAIGESFGDDTKVLHTEKHGSGQALLNFTGRCALRKLKPTSLVFVDDLGTTGASIMPAYNQVNFGSRLRELIPCQLVFYVAIRRSSLAHLSRNKIPYDSATNLGLLTFKDQKQCATKEDGLCKNGVELVPHTKK